MSKTKNKTISWTSDTKKRTHTHKHAHTHAHTHTHTHTHTSVLEVVFGEQAHGVG